MSHDIDQQTIQIEATINQLLSGLPKTYVPFTDIEIWEDRHLGFGKRLEAVCEQDYQLDVQASKIVKRLGWQWLEVENKGRFSCFPDIVV